MNGWGESLRLFRLAGSPFACAHAVLHDMDSWTVDHRAVFDGVPGPERRSGGFEHLVEVPLEEFAVGSVGTSLRDHDGLPSTGVKLFSVAELFP